MVLTAPPRCQANVMHGHGRFRWPDGRTYIGSYKNGLRWGPHGSPGPGHSSGT